MKFENLKSIDVAVLLEKATLLNGMLVHGTKEQKKLAKEAWVQLEAEIRLHVPLEAMEIAKRELALDYDNITLNMLDFENN